MFNKGEDVTVTVDDRLPALQAGTRYFPPNARRSPNNAWWLPILEKAAAKYYGTYENMHGGWMVESLYQLTGMATKWFVSRNYSTSDLWTMLKDWDAKNYIQTAAVMCDSTDRQGVVCGHAYSLIGVREYKGTRLIKVRNPWGSEHYTGPWSDGWSGWTEEARNQLGHTSKDDGTFWIPLNLFKEIFDHVNVAFYEEDFKKTIAPATLASG